MALTVIELCLKEINSINSKIEKEKDDAALVILHELRDAKMKELHSLIKTQIVENKNIIDV